MSIDERLEALTMKNLELLSHATEAQRLASQALDRRIDKLTDAIEKLVAVTNEDATNIRTLAGIVQAHENRISNL